MQRRWLLFDVFVFLYSTPFCGGLDTTQVVLATSKVSRLFQSSELDDEPEGDAVAMCRLCETFVEHEDLIDHMESCALVHHTLVDLVRNSDAVAAVQAEIEVALDVLRSSKRHGRRSGSSVTVLPDPGKSRAYRTPRSDTTTVAVVITDSSSTATVGTNNSGMGAAPTDPAAAAAAAAAAEGDPVDAPADAPDDGDSDGDDGTDSNDGDVAPMDAAPTATPTAAKDEASDPRTNCLMHLLRIANASLALLPVDGTI